MRRSLLVCLGLLGLLISHARALEAHFAGEAVVISDGQHRWRVTGVVEDHAVHATVHAICRQGRDYYLVVGASVWSRGWPPRGGHCGGGTESYIEWFRLRGARIQDRERGLYQSCFQDREGSVEWKQRKLLGKSIQSHAFEVDNKVMVQETKLSWSYDPAHPENGLEESTQEFEAKPNGVTFDRAK